MLFFTHKIYIPILYIPLWDIILSFNICGITLEGTNMNTGSSESKDGNNEYGEIWNKILKASLSIPGAKIDRKAFLTKEFQNKVTEEILKIALESTPAKAKIPKELIENVAQGCIKLHLAKVTSLSFLAGLPGGWWMAGTIPADLTQYFYQAIQLAQKLCYLFGWPEFFTEKEISDDTLYELTLFIGVMFGAQAANKIIRELAENIAVEMAKRIPRKSLTEYGLYNLAKQIGKWIGVKLTKESTGRFLSKLVPILGGFVSGGISYFTLKTMSKRLFNHLRSLPLATG